MAIDVFWTQFAENKLEDIFEYYSVTANKKVASKLVKEIVTISFQLNKTPLIGQKEMSLSNRPIELRYLVYKHYKLIYWININLERVEILNIFDSRQDPLKLDNL